MANARGQSKKKRRRSLLPILLPLIAVAVLILAAVLREPREPDEGRRSGRYVEVYDGVNWIYIVPAEGVPVSDLAEGDFRTEDGVTRYVGTKHSVRQGVDVSEHQGEIDWEAAAGDGVTFAVIRAGFRGNTEGNLYRDVCFADNYSAAADAGLDVGVYFFSQALNEAEAVDEADFVLEILGGRNPDLPVFFDWEPPEEDGARTAGMDGETLTACAVAFCRRIEESGRRSGVYFNRQQGYHDYDLSALKDYVLWVADPNEWTDFYYAVSMWQYSFDGHVDGIPGRVDRDMIFD